MARRVTRCAHGMHARRNLVIAGLEAPLTLGCDFIGKDPRVQTRGDRCELRMVDVDVAAWNVTQPAGVIEVQVPEEYHVDVLRGESQALEVAGNSLVVVHAGRVEPRTHWVEVARTKLRRCDFAIVAADVVEDATVRSLDQVRKDRRLQVLAVSPIAGRHDLLIALRTSQQGPQPSGASHVGLQSLGSSRPMPAYDDDSLLRVSTLQTGVRRRPLVKREEKYLPISQPTDQHERCASVYGTLDRECCLCKRRAVLSLIHCCVVPAARHHASSAPVSHTHVHV